MRKVLIFSVVAVVCAWVVPVMGAVTVMPAGSTVAGKTIGEWGDVWWQWAFSFPTATNPVTDTTGANANNGQTYPVFFLGGSYGSTVARTFTVPFGKPLLLPLINVECSDLEGDGITETALRTKVETVYIPEFKELHATLDGAAAPGLFSHLEYTPAGTTFTFDAVPGHPSGNVGHANVAVAGGYWLMLEPPSLGDHVLNFGGGAPVWQFAVDMTDTITVVPEPAILGLVGLAVLLGRRRR